MAPPPGGAPVFEVNQSCYIPYEGGVHYKAKVVKRELREHPNAPAEKMWYYLVHYMGWSKKHDEWVEETGMSTYNPDSAMTRPGGAPGTKGRAGAGPGKVGMAAPGKPQIKMSLAIPAVLKKQLVADHDAVKGGATLPLPRAPTVNDILESYVARAAAARGGAADEEEQVAHGLRSYFDRALALVLLYVEERPQADEVLADGRLPSSVYGAEHLLRLFVKLPDYLPVDNMLEAQYRLLQEKLHQVLETLAERRSELFLPPSAYAALPRDAAPQ